MKVCPICAEKSIVPSGPKDAKILIIGEFPGDVEMEYGRPFVGPSGKVLKQELRLAGIEPYLCRITNVWFHPPNKRPECLKLGLDMTMEEAKGKEAILLIGSEVSAIFLDKPVTDVCGLQVNSPMFGCDTVFAMLNPAIVFQEGRGVGEIRLALKKFAEACKRKGLLNE